MFLDYPIALLSHMHTSKISGMNEYVHHMYWDTSKRLLPITINPILYLCILECKGDWSQLALFTILSGGVSSSQLPGKMPTWNVWCTLSCPCHLVPRNWVHSILSLLGYGRCPVDQFLYVLCCFMNCRTRNAGLLKVSYPQLWSYMSTLVMHDWIYTWFYVFWTNWYTCTLKWQDLRYNTSGKGRMWIIS